MTVWAEPPLSRREARRKVREGAGIETDTDTVVTSDEQLAAAAAEEEAARFGGGPVVRRNGSGGRRAQWAPATNTSGFAPFEPRAEASQVLADDNAAPQSVIEDNTDESQLEVVPELTMTRRELRALRERAEAAGHTTPDIVFLPERPPSQTTPEVVPGPEVEPFDLASSDGAANETDVGEVSGAATDQAEIIAANAPLPEALSAEAAPIPELINPASADWTFRASRPTSPSTLFPPAEIDPRGDPEAEYTEAEYVEAEHGEAEYVEAEVIEAEIVEEADDDSGHLEVDTTAFEASGGRADRLHEFVPTSVTAIDSTDDLNASERPESLRSFDSLFRAPAAEAPTATSAPTVNATETPAKPYGHWTTQAALDDAAPSSEGFLSRDVGVTTGAITTHALLLPSIPEAGDQLLAPLTTTGEIMITGSIDLPRTFGSTGAHPARFDHSDVDALIEESDREDAVSTSAPVRAIRAVSSTSSSRGVIEAPAKPKSKSPLIIGLAVGGLILVAGAFVAAALIFRVI